MILKDLIYIYQLENYDKKRFLLFCYKNLHWWQICQRGSLEWTIRTRLICGLSIVLIVGAVLSAYIFYSGILALLCVVIAVVFLPILLVFSDMLISPLVLWQKRRMRNRAIHFVRQQKENGLITIGITGSFGKTTMKNVLISVLAEKYSIFSFPGNINTDMGIAQYVNAHEADIEDAQIMIVEMGAYHKGEIKLLCDIVQPDYAFLTAIGECHLERFGSIEAIAETKCELVNAARKSVYVNACDANAVKYVDQYNKGNARIYHICGKEDVTNIQYLKDYEGLSFIFEGQVYATKMIADYIIDFAVPSFALAQNLGLTSDEISKGFEKLQPVKHRLEVIKNTALNRTIIDDSYNGNYQGFIAGLEALTRAQGRKIILTPGIVELGTERSRQVHMLLAEEYIEKVDFVLLVKNANTDYVVEKFDEEGYNAYKIYASAMDAHNDLAHILKDGDTILFQNDITDNYL